MTKALQFRLLQNKVLTLHAAGRYDEALTMAGEARARFPERTPTIAFWEACLEAMAGRPEAAVRALALESDQGSWWSPALLRDDPDLAMLQERDDWQEVLDESRRRHALAMKTSRVEVLVAHPSSRPRALLLVLHGAVDDATLTAPFWNPASAAEVSVAVLGSSQLASSDGARWWRDETRAEQDVAAVRAEMLADHPVPGDRTLLGGFSQGAVRAMSIVLRGEPFDSRGFIAVGPSIRDPETLSSHLDKAAERGVRAVVIAGADDSYAAGCKRWHERMSAAGIASDLAIVSGLGHEYPPDFAARLPGALDFALRPKRWPVIGEMTASEAIED